MKERWRVIPTLMVWKNGVRRHEATQICQETVN